MTPRQLKQLASRVAVRACIVSDGCRDYVVELDCQNGAGLLRHRRGKTLRFRSISEAHQLLARCGVHHTVLRQRVADEEVGMPYAGYRFHDLPISRPSAA